MTPNILKSLADNQALFDAVKEVVLKQFSLDGLDTALTVAVLGEETKARLIGKRFVSKAFDEIALHKTTEEVKLEDMPGR